MLEFPDKESLVSNLGNKYLACLVKTDANCAFESKQICSQTSIFIKCEFKKSVAAHFRNLIEKQCFITQ